MKESALEELSLGNFSTENLDKSTFVWKLSIRFVFQSMHKEAMLPSYLLSRILVIKLFAFSHLDIHESTLDSVSVLKNGCLEVDALKSEA